MQNDKTVKKIVFVSARRPEPAIQQGLEASGLQVHWARSIDAMAGLLNSTLEKTVVITELALADGNWRDLVERVRCLGSPILVVLVTSASTAELWWDALECGVEDILVAPLSASRLFQVLETQSTISK